MTKKEYKSFVLGRTAGKIANFAIAQTDSNQIQFTCSMSFGTFGETRTSLTVSPAQTIPITLEEETNFDYSAVAGTRGKRKLFSADSSVRVLIVV
jgi:hypothetical protein